MMSTTTVILYIIAVIVVLFIVYSWVPNLLVRVMHLAALRKVPVRSSVVLTFDDGPDPKYTPRLLDALREAGIQATFFVIAEKAQRNPDIIERMQVEGHDIQIHGYRHFMVPFLLPGKTVQQVAGASQVLKQRFAINTTWYRPTWGLCNAVTLLSPRTRSHRLITWSIMVGDWKRTSPDTLLRRIADKLHPGAVIVLHDSDETFGSDESAPESVIALIPSLATLVREHGYEFVPLIKAAGLGDPIGAAK